MWVLSPPPTLYNRYFPKWLGILWKCSFHCMSVCNLFLLLKHVFVAITKSAARSYLLLKSCQILVRLWEASPKGRSPGHISGRLAPAFARMSLSTPEMDGFQPWLWAQGCSGPICHSLPLGSRDCSNVQTHNLFWSKGNLFLGPLDSVRSVPSHMCDISIYCPYLSLFMELEEGGGWGRAGTPKILKSSDP